MAGNSNYNVTLQIQFIKSNQQIIDKKLAMIRTRNQNKSNMPNQIKPKPIKKHIKPKKQCVQTDVEDQPQQIACSFLVMPKVAPPQQINLIKPQIVVPPKPKRSTPKFECRFDLKDQIEEYEDEIIDYLKGQQPKYKINQNYLKFHNVLNIKVRNFLVKFIFKMIWKYKCKRSTLYLAVYCMDFYLSKASNFQNTMEAIAVAQASLHIAMKFEQIYPIQLKQWTPDAEQIKKILNLEAQILRTIQFKLNFPSIYYFEQYFQKKFCESQRFRQNKQNLYLEELKINLIADLCLFDVSLYEYQPYQLAKNIRMLVYNIEPPFNEERLVLNIKWALERNKIHLDWLKEVKYKDLTHN